MYCRLGRQYTYVYQAAPTASSAAAAGRPVGCGEWVRGGVYAKRQTPRTGSRKGVAAAAAAAATESSGGSGGGSPASSAVRVIRRRRASMPSIVASIFSILCAGRQGGSRGWRGRLGQQVAGGGTVEGGAGAGEASGAYRSHPRLSLSASARAPAGQQLKGRCGAGRAQPTAHLGCMKAQIIP